MDFCQPLQIKGNAKIALHNRAARGAQTACMVCERIKSVNSKRSGHVPQICDSAGGFDYVEPRSVQFRSTVLPVFFVGCCIPVSRFQRLSAGEP